MLVVTSSLPYRCRKRSAHFSSISAYSVTSCLAEEHGEASPTDRKSPPTQPGSAVHFTVLFGENEDHSVISEVLR